MKDKERATTTEHYHKDNETKKEKKSDSHGRNRKRSKEDIRKFLTSTAYGLCYAIAAYFLGGATLPYGAMPLGVAFLAVSDRRVFYIYAGLILSALNSTRPALLLSVYTALLFGRMLTRLVIDPPWKKGEGEAYGEKTVAEFYPHLFSEHISLRASLAAIGAFAISAQRLFSDSFLYYDLYGTIVATLSAPVALLLTSGYFSDKAGKYRRLMGLLALTFGVLYSIGDRKIYGISLAIFGATLVTLYLSAKKGAVIGALSGALLGLSVSLPYAPLFAFCGLVMGIIYPFSSAFALSAALAVSVAWGIYAEGLSILSGTLSALVSATLIFGIYEKIFLSEIKAEKDNDNSENEKASAKAEMSELKNEKFELEILLLEKEKALETKEKRINELCEGLTSLSALLYKLSSALHSPRPAELRRICDNAFDFSCTGCENREECWKQKYGETTDALTKICERLQTEHRISADDVSVELRQRCHRLPELISQINHNTALHCKNLSEADRTELFASSYETIAELIEKSLAQGESIAINEGLSAEAERLLVKMGIDADGAAVLGEKQKTFALFSKNISSLLEEDGERIKEIADKVCGMPTYICETDQTTGRALLVTRPPLGVTFAKRSMMAKGEEDFCGDTVGIFDGKEGKKFAFISDGMGSGREAATSSGLCGLFLRRLISQGADTDSVLKLLNEFLRNKQSGSLHECSTTVDLLELDLYTERASFYKSGAAPTYIFRNKNLFKLRSSTLPVGIIKELDMRRTDLDIEVGDLVIMVSDGVTDGREECPWLFDLLSTHADTDPVRIAELVIKYARSEGACDDLSVIVAKIAPTTRD